MEVEQTWVSKKLDETVRLSEERDYKGLRRAQVALPVWPAHQPRRSPAETSALGPIVA